MAGANTIGAIGRKFQDHLGVHPPLTDEQLGAIPAKRGVFLLSAADGRAILLATAASIRGRLRGRLEEPGDPRRTRSADLRAITRTLHWRLAGGHFEMDWAYLEIARSIWPDSYPKLLSWRPAWFVRVDCDDPYPHFTRTRDGSIEAGQTLGPFETGRSAQQFIDVVQDAFDLCRDPQCLRRSPSGERCTYGQMGRCLCPCDGSISMDAYRRTVRAAAEFALGPRDEHLRRLRERMRRASAELKFERAAAIKGRLDRLAELDAPEFRYVAPGEDFRFLLVQPSGSRLKAKVFLVDHGAVAEGRSLDWPLVKRQLAGAIRRMERFVAAGARRGRGDPVERWRMGLVARCLFSSERRRGLVLRYAPGLAPAELAAAIVSSSSALGLSEAKATRSENAPKLR